MRKRGWSDESDSDEAQDYRGKRHFYNSSGQGSDANREVPPASVESVDAPGPSSSRMQSTVSNTNLILTPEMFQQIMRSGDSKYTVSIHDRDIPKFDPATDDVTRWIGRLDDLLKLHQWSDRYVCHVTANKLCGNATTWYNSLLHVPTTWDEWKTILRETFSSTRDLHALVANMQAIQPNPGQNLSTYCFDKLAAIRKMELNLSGLDEVSLIVGDLQPDSLKLTVRGMGFKNATKLAGFLNTYKVNPLARSKSNNIRTPGIGMQAASSSLPTTDTSKGAPQARSGEIICYACKKPGHVKRDCPHPVMCFKCHKQGHRARDCKQGDYKEKPFPDARATKINFVSDQNQNRKFYKSVLVNEVVLNAYIDFGSECSLITREAVQSKLKLSMLRLHAPVKLTVFGGYELKVTEYVRCLLEIDSVKLEVDLYVVEDCLKDTSVLVGQNFTENLSIAYSRVGTILTFSNLSTKAINSVVESTESICVGVLTTAQSQVFDSVLSKFRDCFSNKTESILTIPNSELHIKLQNNIPVSHRPFPLANKERDVMRAIVEDLLSSKIIRPSESAYSSPALLVRKKNDQQRLCVDYRALNKITVRDSYPLPRIEQLIDRLSGFKFYTSLDMLSGYHQLKVADDSIACTAFITPDGKYEYLKVPFGLCNAPFAFQRAIDNVLGDLRFTRVIVYLDDILIPSKTVEEGFEILVRVLEIFRKNNVVLNLAKCNFFQTSIQYLGYHVSGNEIRPNSQKLIAVEQFPSPMNIHQVRQFLGLVGYFRKFVENFAEKARPLTNLLKKDTKWNWGHEQRVAFQTLKDSLLTEPVLTLFHPERETMLYTDASRIGLGGILVQKVQERECVVGYYSRHTSNVEQRYHSFELETLAIVSSVKRFRHYLLGIHFKIFTDCSSVRSALVKKELNPRIGRWALTLQEYDFDISHRPGNRMNHVDALSRNPPLENHTLNVVTVSDDDWLLAIQRQDVKIAEIKQILTDGSSIKDISKNYICKGEKVYRRTNHGPRAVIPKACRWQIVRMNHDDIGHFAVEKVYDQISSKYWFAHMRRFIQKYVQSCIPCMFYKSASGKKQGFLHPIAKYPRPFHTIHLDHLGPFVRSKSGNTQVLVIVDAFTKFCFIYGDKSTKCKLVLDRLTDVIKIFGPPMRIITDSGTSFDCKAFADFCDKFKIHHHKNAVGMPRGNGQVERYNRTILSSLAIMGANCDDTRWDDNLLNVQLGINNSVNTALGSTPTEILLGYRTGVCNNLNEVVSDPTIDVLKLRREVGDRIAKSQKLQKERFDRCRMSPHEYEVDDLVLVEISSIVGTGSSRKLLPKRKGPFRIVEKLEGDRYKVADLPGSCRTQKHYSGVYAAERMIPFMVWHESD